MKTILVPTDFSKHSIQAIEYAAKLAEKINAKLILFHSFHVPVAFSEVPGIVLSEVDFELEAEKELKRLVNHVQTDTNKFINVEYANRAGLLLDNLQVIIEEKEVNLIVMGTQGADGLEEFLIGSHSAYVVEKVDCPVLVIPAGTTFKSPKKIMYATDFQFDDFNSINTVAQIAHYFEAEIVITHVSTRPKKAEEEEDLMDWFIEIAETHILYPKISFQYFTGENVAERLDTAVKELGVDMLCMSTVRRTFFEKIYKSSLTKKMAYHTQIPLLAFHIEEPNRL